MRARESSIVLYICCVRSLADGPGRLRGLGIGLCSGDAEIGEHTVVELRQFQLRRYRTPPKPQARSDTLV